MTDSLPIAAIARPGDTVIIGFSREFEEGDIEWLDEAFQPLVDQGVQVMFADQISSIVVARPEGE